jgi:tetratricopeptide (TPR) repeat protein
MKHLTTFLLLFALVSAALFTGCEDDTNITNNMNSNFLPAEQRATEEGWKAYRAHNYQQAVDSFMFAHEANSLYLDAYCGLGWAYGKLDSLEMAHNYFTVCLVSDDNQLIYKDACAGRSFVNLAMGKYDDAILDVRDASMKLVDPEYNIWEYSDYVFRHLPEITDMDLMLVMAEAYFMMNEYQQCYQCLLHIDEELEQTYEPEELAMIIEQMKLSI